MCQIFNMPHAARQERCASFLAFRPRLNHSTLLVATGDGLAFGGGNALGPYVGFGLGLADLPIDIANVALEFANTLPDRCADLRHPARAK